MKEHHITRCNFTTHRPTVSDGWQVVFGWKGKRYTKFFRDTAYGGKRKALKAAMGWRNMKMKEVGRPLVARPIQRPQERKVRRDGDFYRVTIPRPTGKAKRKAFSVRAHGEEKAYALALKARRDAEREVYGEAISQG